MSTPDAPRVRFFATRVDCEEFNPAGPNIGACTRLAIAGWVESGSHVASTLIVTNGNGNPDVLGTPAEYKIWIAGDPERRASYSITITYFSGPDC
jgi:hypothetical protein